LREDNADLRLREKGYEVGLVNPQGLSKFSEEKSGNSRDLSRISTVRVNPTKGNSEILHRWGTATLKKDSCLQEILRRPEIHFKHLFDFDRNLESLPKSIQEQVEIQVKYDGYIKRQMNKLKGLKGWRKWPFQRDSISALSWDSPQR